MRLARRILRRRPHLHDPVGVGIGQRAQQHAVHDTEDRRGRADPEGQRDDRDRGEAGILLKVADRVADIVAHCRYSVRSARTGSSRAARRAGRYAAASVTAASSAEEAVNVTGSTGNKPTNRPERSTVAATAGRMPQSRRPTSASQAFSDEQVEDVGATRAERHPIPISRVRRATPYAVMPYRPESGEPEGHAPQIASSFDNARSPSRRSAT